MNMLCINDLSFQYTTSKKNNLNHISLDIQDGEIVLITGQSGSGKTTLLKHFKKISPTLEYICSWGIPMFSNPKAIS